MPAGRNTSAFHAGAMEGYENGYAAGKSMAAPVIRRLIEAGRALETDDHPSVLDYADWQSAVKDALIFLSEPML